MNDKCKNEIQMDKRNETIENTIKALRLQITLLKHQNYQIHLKLNEDTQKGLEITKLLQQKKPFIRTKTGEVLFPGKKEMEFKLDVMSREILKLRTVLHSLKKERNQLNLAGKNIKKINCSESNNENNKKLSEELCEQYNTMKDTFDKIILEISKYRVLLDTKKEEEACNHEQLRIIQEQFDDAATIVAKIESSTFDDVGNAQKKLKDVKDRLDGLKSMAEQQMSELNAKQKSYMDGIQEKEYQIVRSNNLYKEKAKLSVEFESEFNRVKEHFKKRLIQIECLPAALQAVQKSMIAEKESRLSVEKNVEILSKRLKAISNDSCSDNSIQLLKSKAELLKIEQSKLEKILAENLRCCDEIKTYKYQQKSVLSNIHTETKSKINDLRRVLKAPTDEYLNTIDKLQNQISKIEAYSCFEKDQMKFISSILQNPIDNLTNILNEARQHVTAIENIQNVCPLTCL